MNSILQNFLISTLMTPLIFVLIDMICSSTKCSLFASFPGQICATCAKENLLHWSLLFISTTYPIFPFFPSPTKHFMLTGVWLDPLTRMHRAALSIEPLAIIFPTISRSTKLYQQSNQTLSAEQPNFIISQATKIYQQSNQTLSAQQPNIISRATKLYQPSNRPNFHNSQKTQLIEKLCPWRSAIAKLCSLPCFPWKKSTNFFTFKQRCLFF